MDRNPLSMVDFTRLPSIPRVLLDLVAASRQPKFNSLAIASIVKLDPGLCCRVLAAGNKGHVASSSRSSVLGRVVSGLGPGGVKTVAIHAATQQFFADPAVTGHPSLASLWRHSISCALRARALAQFIDYPRPDEAYLSGLFHLLGEIADPGTVDSMDPGTAGERAAMIMESWNLQGMMADAVRYQQEPMARVLDAHVLVKILNVACALEDAQCRDGDPGYDAADSLLQIQRGELYDLLSKVDEEAEGIFDRLGLIASESNTHNSEALQLDLARQIRNFSLLSAAAKDLAEARDQPQNLASIDRQASILFGLGRTLVFLFNAEENLLDTLDSQQGESLITPFRISLVVGQSLVSDTLLKRKPLNSLSEGMRSRQMVVDRQLTRVLGREGIACIPLTTQGSRIGVLVSGIDSVQLDAFEKQMDLLLDFGELAAANFQRHRSTIDGGNQ